MHRMHVLVDLPLMVLGASGFIAGVIWAVPVVVTVMLCIHAIAVIHPRCGWYLPVHWRLPAGTVDVALTFDDGPNPLVTPQVLDLLAAAGQQATFFVIGEHARAHPELLRRMRAEGHAIGLHADQHARTSALWSTARVETDLRACQAAVVAATGHATMLFRPPMGLKNPLIGSAAARMGVTTVTWSVRGWDTTQPPLSVWLKRLYPGLLPRAIVLLHDGHEPGRAADRSGCLLALAALLPELARRGLRSRALTIRASQLALV